MRLMKTSAESERDQYKREVRKLKNELDQFRSPPLVIGTVESVVDGRRVIVRSTTGPQFLSRLSDTIEAVTVGSQCALHPQSFMVVEVLSSQYDSFVSGMEVAEVPSTTYEDVGGLETQKTHLREAVELPLLNPGLFERVGIEPPKGVLLTGPPGTGKTLLAKAVAHETNAVFIHVVGSELVQKYIGEGARLVRELFLMAREKSPAIIFIDEIDAIGMARGSEAYSAGDHEVNRTLMQLLAELDGFDVRGNVKVVAATNRPDILDKALLRPGRFDRIIEFPLPDGEGRETILRIHTRKMHLKSSVSLAAVAKKTEGMNGSELMAVCVEAGMNAVRNTRTMITAGDFEAAIEAVSAGRYRKAAEGSDTMFS
jgi:proteasome regulatory subunit